MELIGLIIFISLIAVLIFTIGREITCWYFKINKIINNQEKIYEIIKTNKPMLLEENIEDIAKISE